MTKILVLGDTHGEISAVKYAVNVATLNNISTIMQVGDFGYWPHIDHMADFLPKVSKACVQAEIDFYWLDGNHENFDALEEAVDVNSDVPVEIAPRVFYCPRASTWEWDGVRCMALGGAYSIDKVYRVEGLSWWPQELLTEPQVVKAMDRGKVDVLFTHDAPEGACPIISSDYKDDYISRGNRKGISAVMQATQPQILFHGHYHHRYSDVMSNDTKVVGLGRDGDREDSIVLLDTDLINKGE